MITEHEHDLIIRFALGELAADEKDNLVAQLHDSAELRELLQSVQRSLECVALSAPAAAPPPTLKQKLMSRLREKAAGANSAKQPPAAGVLAGLRFLGHNDTGWKSLPVAGAFIKLLSFQPDRGYAVLLGKLDPGARYHAHTNAGPEDFYLLTGDLNICGRELRPGDFHHADAGSFHTESHSVNGCTLLAVMTIDDPLVQLALV